MDAETQKTKRQIVSFTLDPETNACLNELDRHTVFVAQVVTAALGRCPCCNQHWPKRSKRINQKPTSGADT